MDWGAVKKLFECCVLGVGAQLGAREFLLEARKKSFCPFPFYACHSRGRVPFIGLFSRVRASSQQVRIEQFEARKNGRTRDRL